jgi:hypothetical protein
MGNSAETELRDAPYKRTTLVRRVAPIPFSRVISVMSRSPRFLTALLLCAASAALAQKPSGDPAPPRITPDMLRPHVVFLAADTLKGRATGSPGGEAAAQYIAAQYKRIGLEPAGADGSYFQRFPMYRSRLGDDNRLFVLRGTDTAMIARYNTDFAFAYPTRAAVRAPLVFAGYGIDDSAWQKYTDYRGINVKGKAVLILGGVPAPDDSVWRTALGKSRWKNLREGGPSFAKISAARQAGALAVLVVDEAQEPGIRRMALRRGGGMPGLTLKPSVADPSQIPVLFISRAAAKQLLGRDPRELAEQINTTMKPCSFAVPGEPVTLTVDFRIDTVSVANVVGRLRGRSAGPAGQTVVFSAHYDHIGTAANGDVYNGADDDASGTAAVIALAESFHAERRPPRRNLLFLCVIGEEIGLVGSNYYTEHPLVPLDSTMCDLNIDMIGRWDPVHDTLREKPYVYVIGADRNSPTLDSLLCYENDHGERLWIDYTYNAENHPEMLYYRSDHFNFARHGVPVIFFHTGEHHDYHRTTDDVEKIDFEHMAKVTNLIRAVGWKVAEREEKLERKVLGER